MAAPHAFLDILANSQVRDAYLAGRISIILSADLTTILWANGAGARFMGFRTVAESINVDSGFDRLTAHQIEAGLSGARSVRIRGIPQAYGFLVSVIAIEQLGQVVFLRSVAAAAAEGGVVDLTDGLSDETTQAAVLDLSGRVMRASPDFDPYLFATEELSSLLQEAHRDGEVKKRFLAEDGSQPVGMLQLSGDPAIFLLIAAKSDARKDSLHEERDFVFDPYRLPQRFAWKIDAEGKFTEVSPELGKVVGHKYSDIVGVSFAGLAGEWDMDRDGAVRTLLNSYNAWAGRSLDWPVQGEENRVGVELAALPVYSKDHVFSGFRGFGVVNRVINCEQGASSGPHGAQTGRLTAQEHEAFSAIARQLQADIFAVEAGQEEQKPSSAMSDACGGSEEAGFAQQDLEAAEPAPEEGFAKGVSGDETEAVRTAEQPGAAALKTEQEYGDEQLAKTFLPLSQLPVAVLVYRECRALFINPSFLELTGYASADAFLQAEQVPQVLDTWIAQNSLRMASGETVPVDISVRPVLWEDGAPACMASFLRPPGAVAELADRAQMEVLQQKSSQLAALLNMVSDGIILLDSAGIVASANEAAGRMFGFSPAQMKGQLFSCFFSEKSLETVHLAFQAVQRENRSFAFGEGREVEGLAAKGGVLRLRINFGCMEFDECYFLMIRDMSRFHAIVAGLIRDRNHANNVLQKKSRYLALVSHEIRTPINAVIGLSQLMLEEKHGPLTNDRHRDYLADIIRSGEHIMTLINDLLDASKMEEGRLKLDIRPVSLSAILNEVLGLMMPQANAGRVIIRSGVSADLPMIAADARSVRQILLNLLSNAIRFTPQGGHIILSADHHPSNEVLLRVRDTGIGMSPQEMQEAMQPYRQVAHKDIAGSNASAFKGTGLGLPLIKAMAEANHARFELHSEPGKGTLAQITFAAAAQPSAAAS